MPTPSGVGFAQDRPRRHARSRPLCICPTMMSDSHCPHAPNTFDTCSLAGRGLRCHVLWLLGALNRHAVPCRVQGGSTPKDCAASARRYRCRGAQHDRFWTMAFCHVIEVHSSSALTHATYTTTSTLARSWRPGHRLQTCLDDVGISNPGRAFKSNLGRRLGHIH